MAKLSLHDPRTGVICAVASGVTYTDAIGARKARGRRIGIAAEVDPNDVALSRNHMAIDDAQHGNTRFWLPS
jgi:hypothetical protein